MQTAIEILRWVNLVVSLAMAFVILRVTIWAARAKRSTSTTRDGRHVTTLTRNDVTVAISRKAAS